eukprot:363440-Chlamydomonas_euryale.AAC.6
MSRLAADGANIGTRKRLGHMPDPQQIGTRQDSQQMGPAPPKPPRLHDLDAIIFAPPPQPSIRAALPSHQSSPAVPSEQPHREPYPDVLVNKALSDGECLGARFHHCDAHRCVRCVVLEAVHRVLQNGVHVNRISVQQGSGGVSDGKHGYCLRSDRAIDLPCQVRT